MEYWLPSRQLGTAIIDALVGAQLITEDKVLLAIDIVEEEIDVRVALVNSTPRPSSVDPLKNRFLAELVAGALCWANVISEASCEVAIELALAQLDARKLATPETRFVATRAGELAWREPRHGRRACAS